MTWGTGRGGGRQKHGSTSSSSIWGWYLPLGMHGEGSSCDAWIQGLHLWFGTCEGGESPFHWTANWDSYNQVYTSFRCLHLLLWRQQYMLKHFHILLDGIFKEWEWILIFQKHIEIVLYLNEQHGTVPPLNSLSTHFMCGMKTHMHNIHAIRTRFRTNLYMAPVYMTDYTFISTCMSHFKPTLEEQSIVKLALNLIEILKLLSDPWY